MNRYPNLPAFQHTVQSAVDQFNTDEKQWKIHLDEILERILKDAGLFKDTDRIGLLSPPVDYPSHLYV